MEGRTIRIKVNGLVFNGLNSRAESDLTRINIPLQWWPFLDY